MLPAVNEVDRGDEVVSESTLEATRTLSKTVFLQLFACQIIGIHLGCEPGVSVTVRISVEKISRKLHYLLIIILEGELFKLENYQIRSQE